MKDSFGKMPFSIYKAAYYEKGLPHNAISPLDFSMRPNASSNNPGRTYRFYDGPEMLHPFGSGLQYNAWHLAKVSCTPAGALASTEYELESSQADRPDEHRQDTCVLSMAELEGRTHTAYGSRGTPTSADGLDSGARTTGAVTARSMRELAVRVSVRAWHTGYFNSSSTVVMVFAVPPPAAVQGGRALRTLVGFKRIEAAASNPESDAEGVEVTFDLPRRAFLLAGVSGDWGGEKGSWTLEFEGGPSVVSSRVRVVA
jgi:hypothetical protein